METLGENLLDAEAMHPIIDRLKLKRELLAAGDPSHVEIRTALVMSGGGMRGVYSGGVVTGLQAVGMEETFDSVVGVSAGACAGGYLLAGQASLGTSIYYEDLTTKDFINLRRYHSIMDISYLERIMRQGKPLDVAAIQKSRSQLHIGVTRVRDAAGVYLNTQEHSELDLVSEIIASCSVPGVTAQPVELNGELYVDGITGCNNPIDYAINELGATDVLVIVNYPIDRRQHLPASERLVNKLLLRGFSKAFKEAHLSRYEHDGFASQRRYSAAVNIGVLCPAKTTFTTLSKDAHKLRLTATLAESQIVSLLS